MRMNQTEYEVEQRVTKEMNEQFIRNLLKKGGFSDNDLAEAVNVPLEEAIRIRKKIESEGN